MKTLLTSVAVLMIAGTTLTKNDHNKPAKSDSGQAVKVSAMKLAEAKAFLSKVNVRQNKVSPTTADGGI